jgi:zinc/manganese transport system substrate-binding protein
MFKIQRKTTSFILAILFNVFLIVNANSAENQEPLNVVTSFSILENLVQEIGGDRVEIVNLVGRNADAHIYQPKPSDAVAISKAELVIVNGLGFEGWISRLMDNNGYKNSRLVASDGVNVFMHGDEVDPHAWQSFENILIYINNITQALIAEKPEYQDEFNHRRQALVQQVEQLQQEVSKQVASIPVKDRSVVTSHDAFAYLGREFDIQFIAPVGFSGDAEPTAADVASVINQINELGVKALFIENISSPRLLQRIAAEANVVIGGSLYSDALSEDDGAAPNYLTMMRYNIESLITALQAH